MCSEQNADDLMMNIRLYLEPGHTVHCCRGVLELEPLLQQVATICKVEEGVVIFHVVPVFCQKIKTRKVGLRKIMSSQNKKMMTEVES